jgi:hypothetical protein
MRSHGDPDLLLIESMTAPPPLEDARRSLDYWRTRGRALPLYRRAARREAREMAMRWEERVRAAELARFQESPVGRLLGALGIRLGWLSRLRMGKRGLLLFVWGLVPWRLKLVAGGVVAASLLVVLGSVTALALVIGHLA